MREMDLTDAGAAELLYLLEHPTGGPTRPVREVPEGDRALLHRSCYPVQHNALRLDEVIPDPPPEWDPSLPPPRRSTRPIKRVQIPEKSRPFHGGAHRTWAPLPLIGVLYWRQSRQLEGEGDTPSGCTVVYAGKASVSSEDGSSILPSAASAVAVISLRSAGVSHRPWWVSTA